jgi:hypothetical protein
MRHLELEKIKKKVLANNTSRTDKALTLFLLHDSPKAKNICDTLVYDLCGKNWRWMDNYDLFEVVMTVLAVYRYTPSSIDGICMANLAKKMLASETAVGGPYYNQAGEVDISTNAAIALLFSFFKSPLPNVISFLKPYVKTSNSDEYIMLVLAEQSKNRTTASLLSNIRNVLDATTMSDHPYAKINHNTIADQVKADIKRLDKTLQSSANAVWRSVVVADNRHEIVSLSRIFADSLVYRQKYITDELCDQLGKANFFTWMAYTIYDDLIDDNANLKYLPVANVAMRRAMEVYKSVVALYQYPDDIIEKYFNDMDAANAWELEECRCTISSGRIKINKLPRYGNRIVLAKRAAAHVLGPITITFLSVDMTSLQRSLIQKGLFQFLIARQLNDDLHDWKEDIEQGHISFVVGFLLRRLNVLTGEYDLATLTTRMQDYFWESGIEDISNLVRHHVEQARHCFLQSEWIVPTSPLFTDILDYIDDIAQVSVKNHRDQKRFFQEYTQAS